MTTIEKRLEGMLICLSRDGKRSYHLSTADENVTLTVSGSPNDPAQESWKNARVYICVEYDDGQKFTPPKQH